MPPDFKAKPTGKIQRAALYGLSEGKGDEDQRPQPLRAPLPGSG